MGLILDYPRAALALFAAAEADDLDPDVRIVPIRQEQLQERLGERFRELDVPLLVEWPDGRRAALLFVLEEESDPRRFSIHRLAHYCLDLAELCATDRIVPVVSSEAALLRAYAAFSACRRIPRARITRRISPNPGLASVDNRASSRSGANPARSATTAMPLARATVASARVMNCASAPPSSKHASR
jgi:hypothetical protein